MRMRTLFKLIKFVGLILVLMLVILVLALFTFGYGIAFLAGFYWHKYRANKKAMKISRITSTSNLKKNIKKSGVSEARKH